MSVLVKYKKFNEVIDEATVELGSQQYMIIKTIETVLESDSPLEEPQVKEEIQLKIVDEGVPNVILHNMSKEELKEYINVLNYILTQSNKNSNINNSLIKR